MTAPQKVLQPWDDAHFKQFGLKRNVIEPWEDGLRTQLDKAGYEWWYFDTHMDDGTQIVVVFYTKSMIAAKGPLTPFATIEITYPDGRKTEERVDATPSQCRFSTDGCDVKIGPCTVTGDLTNYHIHFQSKNVTAELDLHGTVPSWRPGVGGTLYGDDEAKQFFWLPSVPSGAVRAVVSDHGTTKTYNGSGYHDHNWGNVSIANLVHHWYWGEGADRPLHDHQRVAHRREAVRIRGNARLHAHQEREAHHGQRGRGAPLHRHRQKHRPEYRQALLRDSRLRMGVPRGHALPHHVPARARHRLSENGATSCRNSCGWVPSSPAKTPPISASPAPPPSTSSKMAPPWSTTSRPPSGSSCTWGRCIPGSSLDRSWNRRRPRRQLPPLSPPPVSPHPLPRHFGKQASRRKRSLCSHDSASNIPTSS